MNHVLNKEQKARIRRVLQQGHGYKYLTTPDELHQLVLHWNWDDGSLPFHRLIRQPHCDLGTALRIYWGCAPRWLYQYASRDEVARARQDVDRYDLLKKIEQRVLTQFYTNQSIQFDPRNDGGYNWTEAYTDLPVKQNIPAIMFEATPGHPVEKLPLITVRVRMPNETEGKTVQRYIRQGWRALQQHTAIHPDVEPVVLVEHMRQAVDVFRATLQPFPELDLRNQPLAKLGWLWAEQVHRAYQWDWKVWEWDTGKSFCVVSPDEAYFCFPPTLIRGLLSVPRYMNTTRSLFELLSLSRHFRDWEGLDEEQRQQLKEAYSRNWIISSPYELENEEGARG